MVIGNNRISYDFHLGSDRFSTLLFLELRIEVRENDRLQQAAPGAIFFIEG